MTAATATVLQAGGLEVLVEGQGPETIVLIHGWPDTHRLWDPQVAALRAHFRCVRFTLPGFAPGAARALYSLDEVVEAIGLAVDAAAPDRRVTLLLHDWGCLFGYEFARRHPQRVARVIGVDIGDAGSRRHRASLRLRARVLIVAYQWWLALAWRLGGAAGDRMSRWLARRAHCPAPPAAVHAQAAWPYWVQWTGARGGFGQARSFVPACPMLYLYGARKPFQFHSPEWAAALAARPGCRVQALDAGHWLMVARAAEFNRALLDWLAPDAAGPS